MEEKNMKQQCGNCKFCLKDKSAVHCRRYPPTITRQYFHNGEFYQNQSIPGADADFWCGEWKADKKGKP
jgi:D-arabinose 1-dehydrogenase-like Zn-dependent alcohol dehydrogenase